MELCTLFTTKLTKKHLFHWRFSADFGFPFRRESFRMLSIYAMGGPNLDFLHFVCVLNRLTSTTLCRAPTVITLIYAITRSETFSQNFYTTRHAATYALSLFSSHSMVSSHAGRPTPQTTQGWTSRLEDAGVHTDTSAHILTFGCFTLMRAHIATAPWNNSTDRTSKTNAVTMKIVFETWRGAPSHLWRSLPLEVPAPRLRRFSSGLLTRWPRRGTAAMHRPWLGFSAACLSHSFERPCCAWEDQDNWRHHTRQDIDSRISPCLRLACREWKTRKKTRNPPAHTGWQDFLSLFVSLFCEFIKR